MNDPFWTYSPVGVSRWTWAYETAVKFTATSTWYTIGFDRGTDKIWLDKFLITTDLSGTVPTVVGPVGFNGVTCKLFSSLP